MRTRTIFIVLAGLAVTLIGGALLLKHLLTGSGSPGSYAETIVTVSETINRRLPMTLDTETRFDKTIPGPGNRLTYVYTLVNYDKATADTLELRNKLQSRLKENYRTSPAMEDFRNHAVVLCYRYHDRNGAPFLDITIDPAMF